MARSKISRTALPLRFYERPTKTVARDLLGRILCRRLPTGEILKARIVETEAYTGIKDRGCHTFGGRRTKRTETMWGAGGHAYVYLIYGMHECLNAVTRTAGHPEAVLIRAAEPLQGDGYWKKELHHLRRQDWLKGPGRLCRAMQISREQNGISLCSSELWVEAGEPLPSRRIQASPRIGIDYAGESAAWPLRFFEKGSEFVSGPKGLR